ncbi:TPA: AAA family ATPase [Bacillus cereus]
MYRIRNITAENFMGYRNIDLTFPDEKVTILHGRNGCGKTTLLRIINALLSLNDDFLREEGISKVGILFKRVEEDEEEYEEWLDEEDEEDEELLEEDEEYEELLEEDEEEYEEWLEEDEEEYEELLEEDEDVEYKKLLEDEEYVWLEAEYQEEEEKYSWSTTAGDYQEFLFNLSSIVFGVNRAVTANTNTKVGIGDIQRFLRRENLRLVDDKRSIIPQQMPLIEELADYINAQIKMRQRRISRRKYNIGSYQEQHVMIDNFSMDHVEISLMEKYSIEKRQISQRVQTALFETLASVVENQYPLAGDITQLPKDFEKKLKRYHENLMEILVGLEVNELRNKIIAILEEYRVDFDVQDLFEGKEVVANLINNMIEELEKDEELFNTVSQLVDEFNNHLGEGKQLHIDDTGVKVITPNSEHGIERLSSGERHLLSFLTLLIVEGSDRGIVMIDEPEISLHLEWQSNLLHLFTRFSSGSQIIVATHSPAIAEYSSKCLVKLGGEDKYEINQKDEDNSRNIKN